MSDKIDDRKDDLETDANKREQPVGLRELMLRRSYEVALSSRERNSPLSSPTRKLGEGERKPGLGGGLGLKSLLTAKSSEGLAVPSRCSSSSSASSSSSGLLSDGVLLEAPVSMSMEVSAKVVVNSDDAGGPTGGGSPAPSAMTDSPPTATGLGEHTRKMRRLETEKKDNNVMTGTSGALKLGPNPNRAGSAEAYDVLLVEDVPVSKKIAFMALKKQKYSVAMVSSGEEAIEVYKKAHPNIVLMDIQLPGMNGIETTKLIRQEEAVSNLKPAIIFALTSSVSANDLQQYKDMKLNGCIAKGELLVQSLKRAMEDLAADPGAFVACVNKDSK